MNFLTLLLILNLQIGATSCSSSISVETEGAVSHYKLTALKTLSAKPADTASFAGTNLKKAKQGEIHLKTKRGKSATASLTILSSTEATFVIPDGLGLGLAVVEVMFGDIMYPNKFVIILNHNENSLPLYLGRAEDLCSSESFIDADGLEKKGLRDCVSGSLEACDRNNAIGCLTSDSYPAVAVASLDATKLKQGTSAGPVTGLLSVASSACTTNGQRGCLVSAPMYAGSTCAEGESGCYIPSFASTVTPLKAVNYDTIVASAPTYSTSLTLAGTSGSLASCSSNAISGCITNSTYKAADLSNLAANVIRTATVVAGTTGNIAEAAGACSASGQQNCTASAQFPAAIACTANGSNCFIPGYAATTQPFKAIDYDAISSQASQIATGVSIAGVSGSLAGCSGENTLGCITNATYKSADLSNLAASKVRSGVTIAGTTGTVVPSPSNCAANGGQACVATGSYFAATECTANDSQCYLPAYSASVKPLKAIDYDHVVANDSKFHTSVSIAGTPGTVASCSSNNQQNCLTTSTYRSADLSNLAAGNVRTGVVIAGVTGNVVATASDCATSGQQGCVATATHPAAVTCTDNTSNCFIPTYDGATKSLKAIDYDDLVSKAGSMRGSLTVAGVTGSILTCTANGTAGCVTDSTYRSADLTNLSAGNIKSGVSIAGLTGDYPSLTYRLPGADSNVDDLEAATFNLKVKNSATFEYWTSTGDRYTNTGDADLSDSNIKSGVTFFSEAGSYSGTAPTVNAWDLRTGVTVGSVTGKLPVNCRNTGRSAAIFNYDGALSSLGNTSVTTGTTVDFWDTIEDYNNNTAGLPNTAVAAWSADTLCGGIETVTDDANVWRDVTTTTGGAASTCAADAARCTYLDKISGLQWSKSQAAATWSTAVRNCDALSYNGQSDWRLPVQKELLEATVHGIRATQSANFTTNFNLFFWGSTSGSYYTYTAWAVNLAKADTDYPSKSGTQPYICVRP